MKIRSLLLGAAAIAGLALSIVPAQAFDFSPKAPNLADCLTRHSATYCNASVSTASIHTLAGPGATKHCDAWEIWVATGSNSGYCICPDPLI